MALTNKDISKKIGEFFQVDNIEQDRHLGPIYGINYDLNSDFKKIRVNVVIHPWNEYTIQDTPWQNPHTLMWVVYEDTSSSKYTYIPANGYYTNGYFMNGVKAPNHLMYTPQIPRDSDGTRYYTWGEYLPGRDRFRNPGVASANGFPNLAHGFFEVAVSDDDVRYRHSNYKALSTTNVIMWMQNGEDRTSTITYDIPEPFLAINTMRWWVRLNGEFKLAGEKITTINNNQNKKFNFLQDTPTELSKGTKIVPGYASKLGLFKHGYWMYATTWPIPLYAKDANMWFTYKRYRGLGDSIPWGAPADNYDYTRVYAASGWTSKGFFINGIPVEITDNVGYTPKYAPDTFRFYTFPNGFLVTPENDIQGNLASGAYSNGAYANGQFCKNFTSKTPLIAQDNFQLYTYLNGVASPYTK